MRGLTMLMLLSVLVLGSFLVIGIMISKRVEGQVSIMARLRRQNELILRSAGEGILGLDRQGRATFVNPAGARLLGSDDLIGRHHSQIISAGNKPTAGGIDGENDPLAEVLVQGATLHRDDQGFLRRDGSLFSGEYTATPMRGENGQIEGAVVTFLDVTERKQAEAALQSSHDELARRGRQLDELNRSLEVKVAERTRLLAAKNEELVRTQEELVRKEKLAAVGSLAAGVAHEINNPAAIIRGNVEILRRRLRSEGDAGEEIDEILKHTERISRITQSLLIFAREQQLEPLRPVLVHLNLLLDDILEQVPHQVSFEGIEVVRDFAPGLPPLLGDREKVRQVFTNLVLNAVQAMAGGGTLRVATLRRDGEVEVRVTDTGPGIDPTVAGEIFNPFFTTKPTGTGLGLSVSYGIVQGMKGEIDLESVPGKGAEFRVRLPSAPASFVEES